MRKFLVALVAALALAAGNAYGALMSGSLSFMGTLNSDLIAINAFNGNAFTWSLDGDAAAGWTYSYSFTPSGSNRGPAFISIETAPGIGDLAPSFAYGGTVPGAGVLATLTPTSPQFTQDVNIDYRINRNVAVAASNTHVPALDPLTGAEPYGYEAWLGSGASALPVHVNTVLNGLQLALPSRTYGMTNGPSQPGLVTGYNAGGTSYQVVLKTMAAPMWGRFYLDGGDWTSNNGWLMAYNREYDTAVRPPFVLGTNQSGWIPVPGDNIPPALLSTAPADGATGVPLATAITITFSEPVDPATVTAASLTVANQVKVPGTVSYDATSRSATFTPSTPLMTGTAYTVTLASGVKDLFGNAMATGRVWSFTTTTASDTPPPAPPAVVATFPADGATAVVPGTFLTATFSSDLDPATINAATFTVGGVAGTVSYDATSRTATFAPATPLPYGTQFTATLAAGITGIDGQSLSAARSWSFTTMPAPDLNAPTVLSLSPGNGSRGAGVKGALSVAFSEALDPATVNGTTFTLQDPAGQSVDGTVAYLAASNTAQFIPSGSLSYYGAYTARLTGGIRDLAGNALAPLTWSFTTQPLYGDLDGSGGVPTVADALLALRIAVGLQVPTAYQRAACDVAPLAGGKPSPDGKVDGGDVIVILRRAVGLDNW
ncbi:Ig-like domain-containing protein [Geomesophilobacter sediminis]|uniref:Ig-like domain-containing protein n=1 Tax=Geomesophilobacter sediminis TaxID=2798584 RepID=A0A8J7IY82_9BACT|nr:Ig-like domain-containing protein [Geomesophilobacter sediminis]MBJ6725072.1 Ig-like domain-containing protein [Geomesophilobacter sediminis]